MTRAADSYAQVRVVRNHGANTYKTPFLVEVSNDDETWKLLATHGTEIRSGADARSAVVVITLPLADQHPAAKLTAI